MGGGGRAVVGNVTCVIGYFNPLTLDMDMKLALASGT